MTAGIETEHGSSGHVTLTTPLLGVICHFRLGIDTFYLYAKVDDSSLNRSRDITGGPKILCGSSDPNHNNHPMHKI